MILALWHWLVGFAAFGVVAALFLFGLWFSCGIVMWLMLQLAKLLFGIVRWVNTRKHS